jgi:cytochrome c oxidase subunit II
LHIPVGVNVKLTMTTEDVIHNFAIPDFRTKSDVVPGRYTYLWFNATKPGKYRIQCMEYCGLNHSGMGGYVYAMEQHEFDNWLSGNQSNQTPVQAGEELFANRLGCASCHQQNDQGRGPTLNGVFGSQVKLASGQLVTADEEYIRQSILNPQGQIVAGYQPIMPTFKGQLTEEQLVSLVEYIKSLGGNSAGSKGNSTSPTNMPTQGGGNTMGTGNTSTGTGTVAPRANRGDTNSQGSNPNAPPDRPEPTNRPR